jgi:hypothetical protein
MAWRWNECIAERPFDRPPGVRDFELLTMTKACSIPDMRSHNLNLRARSGTIDMDSYLNDESHFEMTAGKPFAANGNRS